MKKVVSLVLVSFLIILSIVPCMAEEDVIISGPKKSKQVGSTFATIAFSGTSTTVQGVYSGASTVSKGKITLELQKKSGSSYQTVKKWSKTVTGSSGAYSEKKVINPSATYRLKATFTLYSSSGSQTYVKYAS